MSFLYPRTITIARKATTSAVGDQGFSAQAGPTDATTVVVNGSPLSGLAASIQIDRQGQRNPVGLPTDALHATIWRILIDPTAGPPVGSIKTADIVTDDAGIAYQVFGPYWNSLGWQLRCTLLEV